MVDGHFVVFNLSCSPEENIKKLRSRSASDVLSRLSNVDILKMSGKINTSTSSPITGTTFQTCTSIGLTSRTSSRRKQQQNYSST